jgi:hypothetical protein
MGGGEGERSIVVESEEKPIADAPKKKERKVKALTVKKSELDTRKIMAKQIESEMVSEIKMKATDLIISRMSLAISFFKHLYHDN